MTDSAVATPAASTSIDPKRALIAAPVAALCAAAANVAFYFLAKASHAELYGNFAGAGSPLTPLPIAPVIVSSAVPALVAGGLLALLGKFAPGRALLIFEVIAGIVVLASLGLPFVLPETTSIVTKIVLCAMHVIAGAVTVGVLGTMGTKRP